MVSGERGARAASTAARTTVRGRRGNDGSVRSAGDSGLVVAGWCWGGAEKQAESGIFVFIREVSTSRGDDMLYKRVPLYHINAHKSSDMREKQSLENGVCTV